jgi:adenylate kinase family enzyme
VVLDGFPRHLPQARWLLSEADRLHNGLRLVIHLTLPEAVARERLLARRRSDDTLASIDARLSDYRTQVLPVVDFFLEKGIPVKVVDGDRPVEVVFAEIDEALTSVHQS